jgi:hypothetical protein
MRQLMALSEEPAYVSIRQHASSYVSVYLPRERRVMHKSAYVGIHQHALAYASIRQHTTAYVSIRQHTPAYASIRQRIPGARARR